MPRRLSTASGAACSALHTLEVSASMRGWRWSPCWRWSPTCPVQSARSNSIPCRGTAYRPTPCCIQTTAGLLGPRDAASKAPEGSDRRGEAHSVRHRPQRPLRPCLSEPVLRCLYRRVPWYSVEPNQRDGTTSPLRNAISRESEPRSRSSKPPVPTCSSLSFRNGRPGLWASCATFSSHLSR